jgi:hypothetical protein
MRHAGLLAGIALAMGAAPLTGQGIPVTVGVGAIRTGAGAFDLPIMLDMSARTEKLGSFVITVRWNPAVVQAQGGVSGTFGDVTVNDDSLAVGVLHMTGVNPAGVGGLITLAVGRFTVLANDTTTFRVTVRELYAAGTFADLTASAVPLDRLYCGSVAGRWGDLNRDDAVNAADALIVLTESVGLDVSQYAVGFGDVDASGARNPRDALIILSFAVGINTASFRVGQTVSGSVVCTPPGAQSYGMNPASAQAMVGQEVGYFAFGLDSSGAALALRNVTWLSSNPAVATVDGFGVTTALSAGTATISARQNDTTIASGTLTVGPRRTHWVDALATNARNQLGSATHPFAEFADAVGVAAAGDTVRVRAGRYAGARITRRLVVLGDTSAGGPRPLLVPANVAPLQDTVVVVDAAGRVELRDLRVDTAYIGVAARATDTVVIRGVEVRGTAGGVAGIRVDNARLLHVAQSRIIGIPSTDYYYYYAADGIIAASTDRLVVDSTVVSDFTSDAIYALLVDTIVVRGSVLRRNAGSALVVSTTDSASASRLTFSRNRVEQNTYGGVTGYYVADAQFDHNVFVGGGYSTEGISLTGHAAATAAFRADSFDIREGGWLYFSGFDSLLIDSARIRQTDYYGAQLYDGRIAVVQNSTFRDLWQTGVYFSGRGVDQSTLLVRNSEFQGRSTAGQYYYYNGYGIDSYYLTADVQDTRFAGLYMGLEVPYGALRLRRVTFDDVGYGMYSYCLQGASTVDSVTVRRAAYEALYGYGCGTGPSPTIELDSLDVADAATGLYVYDVPRVGVHRSRFANVGMGVYVRGDTLALDALDLSATGAYGLDATADSAGSLTGSTVSCASSADGFRVQGPGAWTVQGNSAAAGCYRAFYLYASRDLEARGNTVTGPGTYGLYSYQTNTSRHRLVGNTLSGAFQYGSIHGYLTASTAAVTALRVDSNTVTSAGESAVYVEYGDTVLVRDNVINGTQSAACCLSYEGGIVLTGYVPQGGRIDIRRNRMLGNVRGIVLARGIQDSLVQVTVDSNRVVGSDTTGLFVTAYSRIQARYNLIDSTRALGVMVDRTPAGTTGDALLLVFASNNITRNGKYGMFNQDAVGQPGLINAQGNWWGDAAGPRGVNGSQTSVTGDSVSAGVVWDPQLPSPVTTVLPPAPPAFAAAALQGAASASRAPARRYVPRTLPAAVAPTLRDPFTPRARAEGDPWAALLRAADQGRAAEAALRIERLRRHMADRLAERERLGEERAARAARAAAEREERP